MGTAGNESPVPATAVLAAAADDVIASAAATGITLRLLGGIAVFQLAPSARMPPLARPYHDFDVVVPARQGQSAAEIFRRLGYAEDAHFNALHGAQRMVFTASSGFVVDLLVGTFQMCHRLHLGRDLPTSGSTIHPADLLLTKLQIVQMPRAGSATPKRAGWSAASRSFGGRWTPSRNRCGGGREPGSASAFPGTSCRKRSAETVT